MGDGRIDFQGFQAVDGVEVLLGEEAGGEVGPANFDPGGVFGICLSYFVFLVESRETIMSRPSLLNLDVRLSPHPASDLVRA